MFLKPYYHLMYYKNVEESIYVAIICTTACSTNFTFFLFKLNWNIVDFVGTSLCSFLFCLSIGLQLILVCKMYLSQVRLSHYYFKSVRLFLLFRLLFCIYFMVHLYLKITSLKLLYLSLAIFFLIEIKNTSRKLFNYRKINDIFFMTKFFYLLFLVKEFWWFNFKEILNSPKFIVW